MSPPELAMFSSFYRIFGFIRLSAARHLGDSEECAGHKLLQQSANSTRMEVGKL
ncbi:MAG: hypothetical protein ACI9G1_003863 [Pirellulaceae bacterium]|jgi:hypothetical protein